MPEEPASEPPEPELRCVGALIRDGRHRVFAHRRSATRRLFPSIWDIVGGHVEPGETVEQALARELEEETGWTLRRIQAELPYWDWEFDGQWRREFDFLVEVDGDLSHPRLEQGKHDAYEWVGPDNLEQMMVGRDDGDRRLRDVVARATRTRLTERLRLDPGGPDHADELWGMHQDPAVAEWHGGRWTVEAAQRRAAEYLDSWEVDGVGKWMAYDSETGEFVGRGGLSRTHHVPGRPRCLEVGWTLRSDQWGKGYATEIGQAGLTFGFDEMGADEIVAFTETANRRSRAVMERLDMRYERDFPIDDQMFALYVADRLTHPYKGKD